MALRTMLVTAACILTFACCHRAWGQQPDSTKVELAQFEVPEIVPPSFDSRSQEVISLQEDQREEVIPQPLEPDPTAMNLVAYPPVAYAPGTDAWAGYCGHEETLCRCSGPPAWASIDVLWLNRNNPHDYVLATDDFDDVVLRTDDFSFDFEPGIRVTYGQVICCTPVEFSYFGLHDWDSSIYVEGDNDLDVPFAPLAFGAFENADFIDADYDSKLNSFEINMFQSECCGGSWLAGIRLIDVEERFRMWTEDAADPDGGYLSIGTDNILLGLQAGGVLEQQYNCWCLSVSGKVGGYLNFADGSLYVYDRDGALTPLEIYDAADTVDVAFVGEFNVGVSRHLCAGVSLRAGYQLTWISGVALAPEQVGNGVTSLALDTNGSVLYNGGYFGLEWQR